MPTTPGKEPCCYVIQTGSFGVKEFRRLTKSCEQYYYWPTDKSSRYRRWFRAELEPIYKRAWETIEELTHCGDNASLQHYAPVCLCDELPLIYH